MLKELRYSIRAVKTLRTLARHQAAVPPGLLEAAPASVRTLYRLGSFGIKRPATSSSAETGSQLAAGLQTLGPSFIKLGQFLATRPDAVGEAIAHELMALQDHLPPFEMTEIAAAISAEFGAPLDDLFETFDETPVAAASIAQVHRATTGDGTAVAVKVLRPGIEHEMADDLEFFAFIAARLEQWAPGLRRLRPMASVRMLASTVKLELDLRMEAAAASELSDLMVDLPRYRVPSIDWDRTGQRVLTLEWVTGIPIGSREELKAAGHDLPLLARTLHEAFLTQALSGGFFHADMHQGNFLVDEHGTIVALDFGIMGRLDQTTRKYLGEILLGFIDSDYTRVAQAHFDAGYVGADYPVATFAQACRSIGEPILDRPSDKISVGRLLGQLFQITDTFEMQTQPQLLLLQRTMVMAEGIARSLDPTCNIWEIARAPVTAWMKQTFSPLQQLQDTGDRLARLGKSLPEAFETIEKIGRHYGADGPRLHPADLEILKEQQSSPSWLWPALIGLAAIIGGFLVFFP